MRHLFLLLASLLLTACVTSPKPPVRSNITFLSMEPAKVDQWIIMGDHDETYQVDGYKIRFKSEGKIAPSHTGDFRNLDFYECNASQIYDEGDGHSAKDYVSFSSSFAELIDQKVDGSFIYEAQLAEEYLQQVTAPICAIIFVHDGNINRKIWRPNYISNPIELKF